MKERDALHLEIVEALLTEGYWLRPLVLGESTRIVHGGGRTVWLIHNTEAGPIATDWPLDRVAGEILKMRAAANENPRRLKPGDLDEHSRRVGPNVPLIEGMGGWS